MKQSEQSLPNAFSIDEAAEAVSTLEGDVLGAQTRTQFDALFKRAHALVKQVAGEENLNALERAAVEQHVHAILTQARTEYDRNRNEASAALTASVDRIALALETLADACSITTVQEVRADLLLIRKNVQAAGPWAARDSHARAWALWQKANQSAWDALNEHWRANEAALGGMLDRAADEMARGNPRAAKTSIKQFHDEARTAPGSHATMRTLRVRARELWDQATTASQERHEAYLLIARKRLDYMRMLLGRAQHNRRQVEAQVSMVEVNIQNAQTDVAAALLRGQLGERRKELRRLDMEMAALVQRIDEAERVLS